MSGFLLLIGQSMKFYLSVILKLTSRLVSLVLHTCRTKEIIDRLIIDHKAVYTGPVLWSAGSNLNLLDGVSFRQTTGLGAV